MRITKYNLALHCEERVPCLVKEDSKNYPQFSQISDAFRAVQLVNTIFGANLQPEEHCYMVAFRSKRVVGVFELGHGTINTTIITPKEVFTRLLLSSATHFIFFHNHPSGDSSPSEADVEITKKLKEAGNMMGLFMLDHIIIGEHDWDYYSFQERSKLLDY